MAGTSEFSLYRFNTDATTDNFPEFVWAIGYFNVSGETPFYGLIFSNFHFQRQPGPYHTAWRHQDALLLKQLPVYAVANFMIGNYLPFTDWQVTWKNRWGLRQGTRWNKRWLFEKTSNQLSFEYSIFGTSGIQPSDVQMATGSYPTPKRFGHTLSSSHSEGSGFSDNQKVPPQPQKSGEMVELRISWWFTLLLFVD